MTPIWEVFQNHDGRPIHKWLQYFPAYERHFERFRGQPITFMEIGCGQGGCLQMWKHYFGPSARIVGIDIEPICRAYEEEQIAIRIGSQDDLSFLEQVVGEFGSPDVVLDDGSHVMEHVTQTFQFLYPRVSQNGVYMLEDLHTAYWPKFGGGLGSQASFIEKSKRLIDQLNAYCTEELEPDEFTKTTTSIHFYDSLMAFEKGPHEQPSSVMNPATDTFVPMTFTTLEARLADMIRKACQQIQHGTPLGDHFMIRIPPLVAFGLKYLRAGATAKHVYRSLVKQGIHRNLSVLVVGHLYAEMVIGRIKTLPGNEVDMERLVRHVCAALHIAIPLDERMETIIQDGMIDRLTVGQIWQATAFALKHLRRGVDGDAVHQSMVKQAIDVNLSRAVVEFVQAELEAAVAKQPCTWLAA
ncbi:MAG: hypothetical protein H7838_00190 [Magnetococcus sp. DMHC-8]